jgi:hypothetical protein
MSSISVGGRSDSNSSGASHQISEENGERTVNQTWRNIQTPDANGRIASKRNQAFRKEYSNQNIELNSSDDLIEDLMEEESIQAWETPARQSARDTDAEVMDVLGRSLETSTSITEEWETLFGRQEENKSSNKNLPGTIGAPRSARESQCQARKARGPELRTPSSGNETDSSEDNASSELDTTMNSPYIGLPMRRQTDSIVRTLMEGAQLAYDGEPTRMSAVSEDPDDYNIEVEMEHGDRDTVQDTRSNKLKVPLSQYHPGQTPRRVSTQREKELRGGTKEFARCGECDYPLNTPKEKQIGVCRRCLWRNWIQREQEGKTLKGPRDDKDDEDGERRSPSSNRSQTKRNHSASH